MGLTDFFLGLDAIRLASDASGPYEVQTISMVTSVMNKALEINQETFKSLDLCPEIVPLKVPLTDAAARLAIFAIDRQAAVDPIYFEAGYEILVRRTNNLLAATTELRLPTSE
ncbi:MAG TPA: hypothetical protein VJR27_04655 [Candidatus Saccharimonadales bacterium]|nr:hypothetical protein [Candidatus Saccharimonadales bacterium]